MRVHFNHGAPSVFLWRAKHASQSIKSPLAFLSANQPVNISNPEIVPGETRPAEKIVGDFFEKNLVISENHTNFAPHFAQRDAHCFNSSVG